MTTQMTADDPVGKSGGSLGRQGYRSQDHTSSAADDGRRAATGKGLPGRRKRIMIKRIKPFQQRCVYFKSASVKVDINHPGASGIGFINGEFFAVNRCGRDDPAMSGDIGNRVYPVDNVLPEFVGI